MSTEQLQATPDRRPRIGLTTYWQRGQWGVWDEDAAIVPGAYVRAVEAAGGVPLLLPPVGTDESVLDILDGLIVIGGVDVDPAEYGADPHPTTFSQPERDRHDLMLTRGALERHMPLFAICRGAQILNVALGGTLIQHLPDSNPNAGRYQPSPGQFGEVDFSTAPGSLINELVGSSGTAPCYHHQGLDSVGNGLRVTARADDGTIEAVETDDDGWALGVQFHPEQNIADLRLFRGFTEAAREYQRRDAREAVS